MTTRYTFDNDHDYFNSVLSSTTTPTTYSMYSVAAGKKRLDITTVTSSDGRTAFAHWRDKGAFELRCEKYPMFDVGKNMNVEGLEDGRRWIMSGEEYLTGWDAAMKTWKVFRVHSGTQDDKPVALFHEAKSKALEKDELPAIIVDSDVSEDEFLTILLLLLWCGYLRFKEKADAKTERAVWAFFGIFCCFCVS